MSVSVMIRPLAILLPLAALNVPAQRLNVYSPFTRIGPDGSVVKADKGSADPRSILSPGVPRNGTTPLRIVVELDKPEPYWLDLGQNPENAVKLRLYRENFVETPDGYLPDTLTAVNIPYRGFETDFRLPGQKAVTFWLEMGVANDAPVERIKVEPELYVDSVKDWIIYPMEVRVQSPQVPGKPVSAGQKSHLPPLTAPADAAVFAVLCDDPRSRTAPESRPPEGQTTGRELIHSYVQQDLSLLKKPADLEPLFRKITGVERKGWCSSPKTLPTGPEWYLRLRDAIYKQAGASD